MILELKENELYKNNRPAGPGRDAGRNKERIVTQERISISETTAMTMPASFPDVEWHRSESARFQQNQHRYIPQ